MTDAEILDVADALVTFLEAGTFSEPYVKIRPERLYDPAFEPDQLATLKVSVVPAGWTDELIDREEAQADYTVWVGFQKHTDKSRTDMDALTRLVSQVTKYCLRANLDVTVDSEPQTAQAMSAMVGLPDLFYSIDTLRRDRVFLSWIAVTFRLVREVP